MVNIDTVYQRVLSIANKEQRGYITPQEFNLFANQAQMDIFEQYFYDKNQFDREPGNETETSDMIDLLDEKLDRFQVVGAVVGAGVDLPTNPRIYRLGSVFYSLTGVVNAPIIEAQKISRKEWSYIRSSPLAQPMDSRPVYLTNGCTTTVTNFEECEIEVFGTGNIQLTANVTCNYIRRPRDVRWGYVVVNDYAQYNSTDSIFFELNESEETNLVLKILQLGGIVMKDANLYQIAAQEEVKDIQQEKQ
jgi:hypothetical protein